MQQLRDCQFDADDAADERDKPSECWPVSRLISVLFPTDGKPMKPLTSAVSKEYMVQYLEGNLHTGHTGPSHIKANCSV
jgi:hypothetical protein